MSARLLALTKFFQLLACSDFHLNSLQIPVWETGQYHNTPLLPPKKICIGIVLDFPEDIFMSQEKLQTMIMQNFGGVKEVYYGICANRELVKHARVLNVYASRRFVDVY